MVAPLLFWGLFGMLVFWERGLELRSREYDQGLNCGQFANGVFALVILLGASQHTVGTECLPLYCLMVSSLLPMSKKELEILHDNKCTVLNTEAFNLF